MAKRLDKAGLEQLSDRVKRGKAEPKPPPMGKKEAAQAAANEVGGKYRSRPGPLVH